MGDSSSHRGGGSPDLSGKEITMQQLIDLAPIFVLVATFWAVHRWHLSLVKTREEKKLGRQAVAAPAVETATPKGPGIMYRSTLLFFKGIKWTTPRLFAGIRKVGRFTFMVSKAGAKASGAKYQAYRANKVATAKIAAAPAVPVSPVVDWDQYEQPAYQRVRNASADQHHQIH
jgi:hypothetical protein